MIRVCAKPGYGRFLYGLLSLLFILCVNCGGDSAPSSSTTRPVLVLGDIHFNPFYDPDLFPELMASPPELWPHIFEGSVITEPQSWGKETNYPLLVKLLDAVQSRVSSSPVVLFQGDILAHKFRETFFGLYGEQDEAALRTFVHKTVAFFVDQLRGALPEDTPVMFVLGNNDSYAGDYRLIPGGDFLMETAELFYTEFLLRQVDCDTFKETYCEAGYYKAQPLSSKVVFICLNTLLFSVNWSGEGTDAPEQHLAWLRDTLADAQASGKKVWLVMHVPPGADIYGTVAAYMDETGHISDAAMMWKPDYQERFMEMMREYTDIIQAGFAGHTHMDEYRLVSDSGGQSPNPVLITPGISPVFGNNPAFKIFDMGESNWELRDYRSMVYPFDGGIREFSPYYLFSSVYQMEGPLTASLSLLWPRLSTDTADRQNYTHFYYSGHDAGNPVNDINWPAYWCAVGNMDKEDYMACVNSYR